MPSLKFQLFKKIPLFKFFRTTCLTSSLGNKNTTRPLFYIHMNSNISVRFSTYFEAALYLSGHDIFATFSWNTRGFSMNILAIKMHSNRTIPPPPTTFYPFLSLYFTLVHYPPSGVVESEGERRFVIDNSLLRSCLFSVHRFCIFARNKRPNIMYEGRSWSIFLFFF